MRRILIIAVVVGLVLAFMVTFVVRFNENAVVATLGKADDSSVVRNAGLHFRWPYPFQKVTTYDTRVRLFQSKQETQQLEGGSQIQMQTFLTWRVDDPLKFYRAFSGSGDGTAGGAGTDNPRDHYALAEKIIEAKLRSAASEVSRYRLDQLLSPRAGGAAAGAGGNGGADELARLEDAILRRVKGAQEGETPLAHYGIEPVKVGVAGMGFPQDTTRQVFDRMRAGRNSLANQTIAQGQAEAAAIRSGAEQDAKKIAAFADNLAGEIRRQGEIESAAYLREMQEDPQLAVFLQNMDFMRRAFGSRVTFVLPTSMPGLEFLTPDAGRQLRGGRPPAPSTDRLLRMEGLRPAGADGRGLGEWPAGGPPEGDAGVELAAPAAKGVGR